jgi:DNA mismatch endonuclease, patch repair protein
MILEHICVRSAVQGHPHGPAVPAGDLLEPPTRSVDREPGRAHRDAERADHFSPTVVGPGYRGHMAVAVPPSPSPSSPGRSRNMAAIRRRDTGPEKRIRSLLHASGLRFRVDYPIRIGNARPIRPDIVFTRRRLAVFVDGCYWHGCPDHGRRSAGVNASYWGPKIARNQERDAEHTALLESAGWTVLRFWEHAEAREVALAIRSTMR